LPLFIIFLFGFHCCHYYFSLTILFSLFLIGRFSFFHIAFISLPSLPEPYYAGFHAAIFALPTFSSSLSASFSADFRHTPPYYFRFASFSSRHFHFRAVCCCCRFAIYAAFSFHFIFHYANRCFPLIFIFFDTLQILLPPAFSICFLLHAASPLPSHASLFILPFS